MADRPRPSKLSKAYCAAATYEGDGASKDIRWDTDPHGFGLRVYPSGKKSWVVFYRTETGRQRLMAFGRHGDLTLDEARLEAKAALGQVAKKEADPLDERRRLRQGETLKALHADYLEKWAKKRKRTWREDERQIKAYLDPALGALKVAEVTRRDVRALIERLGEERGEIQALQAYALVRRILNWAVETDRLPASPANRLKFPWERRRRDRILGPDELRAFWAKTGDPRGLRMGANVAAALRTVLLTAQRPGEVVGLHRRDLDGPWWTLRQTKNRQPHRAYLGELAREVLGPWQGYRFPSPRKGLGPVTERALPHAVAADGFLGLAHWTPHDLRRTAATGLGALGVSRFLLGRILNHSDPSVTGIYDRHRYDAEVRGALEAWETHLRGLLGIDLPPRA